MPPRRRKNKEDSWLPDRVYRGHSAYNYHPKSGGCIRLHGFVYNESGERIEPPNLKLDVLNAWKKAVNRAAITKDMNYWLDEFLRSERYMRLGEATRSDYYRYIHVLAKKGDAKSRNGIRSVFGKMMPENVNKTHIRKYMDYWAKADKKPTANRHLSCLQTFFKWIMEYYPAVTVSPAHGITKFKETARKVLITDEHHEMFLQAALESSTPYMFAYFELLYLCGLRRNEPFEINIEDILDGGLRVGRSKGSKGEITRITPRLAAAIDFAISLHQPPEPIKNRPLLRNLQGNRLTVSSVKNAFNNIRKTTGLTHYTLHDFKKKAGTDDKDLGHKTARMRDLYDLKLKVKDATR